MLVEHHHAGRRDAHDDVGLRVGFFREHFRGDDAGGIAHPFQFDVRLALVEAVGIGFQLVGFERGVDEQLGFLGEGGAAGSGQDQRAKRGNDDFINFMHVELPEVVVQNHYAVKPAAR